jgi:hypothetical protein
MESIGPLSPVLLAQRVTAWPGTGLFGWRVVSGQTPWHIRQMVQLGRPLHQVMGLSPHNVTPLLGTEFGGWQEEVARIVLLIRLTELPGRVPPLETRCSRRIVLLWPGVEDYGWQEAMVTKLQDTLAMVLLGQEQH